MRLNLLLTCLTALLGGMSFSSPARAAQPLPVVDSSFMDGVLTGATGADRTELDKRYREFIRDYEGATKKLGLPGPDVDPEPRNRRIMKAFKNLPVPQRITLVQGARKELPDYLSKSTALDAQNRRDDQKSIDGLLDSLASVGQVPVPTEDSAPVYFGDMLQRLGLVGRGGRARRGY